MLLDAPVGHFQWRFVGALRQERYKQWSDGFAMPNHTINLSIRRHPRPKTIHLSRSGDETVNISLHAHRRLRGWRGPAERRDRDGTREKSAHFISDCHAQPLLNHPCFHRSPVASTAS